METYQLFFDGAFVNAESGETRPFVNPCNEEPIGVCVGIIPWNFPFMMAVWKIAPALNVVTGRSEAVGEEPCTNPMVDKVALTGCTAPSQSDPTGKSAMRTRAWCARSCAWAGSRAEMAFPSAPRHVATTRFL